jgi:hypothetical protein
MKFLDRKRGKFSWRLLPGDELLPNNEFEFRAGSTLAMMGTRSGTAVSVLAGIILSPPMALAQNAASGSALDLSAVVQPVLAVVGAVIAGLLTIYVPKALTAFQVRTSIALTDQQRAAVLGAVRTAAGMIETRLDQGALRVARIDIANPTVRAEAVSAIGAVPLAAAALNMTVDGVARMIVGAVDTGAHPATAVIEGTAATLA